MRHLQMEKCLLEFVKLRVNFVPFTRINPSLDLRGTPPNSLHVYWLRIRRSAQLRAVHCWTNRFLSNMSLAFFIFLSGYVEQKTNFAVDDAVMLLLHRLRCFRNVWVWRKKNSNRSPRKIRSCQMIWWRLQTSCQKWNVSNRSSYNGMSNSKRRSLRAANK